MRLHLCSPEILVKGWKEESTIHVWRLEVGLSGGVRCNPLERLWVRSQGCKQTGGAR